VISELSQFELLFLLSSVKFSILFFYINRENARAMLNCGILLRVTLKFSHHSIFFKFASWNSYVWIPV
jgi:hypothetical protein